MFKINQLKKNRTYYCLNYTPLDSDTSFKVIDVGRTTRSQYAVLEYTPLTVDIITWEGDTYSKTPRLVLLEDDLENPRFSFVFASPIREVC